MLQIKERAMRVKAKNKLVLGRNIYQKGDVFDIDDSTGNTLLQGGLVDRVATKSAKAPAPAPTQADADKAAAEKAAREKEETDKKTTADATKVANARAANAEKEAQKKAAQEKTPTAKPAAQQSSEPAAGSGTHAVGAMSTDSALLKKD